jgi:MFS family permease
MPDGPTEASEAGAVRQEDRRKIYLAKTVRSVAYGLLSGALVLYLNLDLGYSALSSLVVTGLTVVGAGVASLVVVTPVVRRFGVRRSFGLFSGLFTLSAVLLFLAANPVVVVAAVLLGGVAATSADNGPLASLDQAVLPSTLPRRERLAGFARYNLFGYFASAGGALLLAVPNALTPRAIPLLPPAPHPWILIIYLALAGASWGAYATLSPRIEEGMPRASTEAAIPLSSQTRQHVRSLTALFGTDAFAGGLVINPIIAAYFVLAWHQSAATIGTILFLTGILAGASSLIAIQLGKRYGLLRTMVVPHLVSNVFLVALPFMPTFILAVGLLAARSSLSQIDVPTRQAYTMALVARRERTPVASTLNGTRSVAQSVGPFPAAAFEGAGYLAVPFVLAGAAKIVYDVALYLKFRSVPVTGERTPGPPGPATSSASPTRGSR